LQPLNAIDLFAAYVEEREGATLLRHAHGFGIYKPLGDFGYLQDVYVLPEYRQRGVGRDIVAKGLELCRKSNKKALLTTTDATANGASESALAILRSGFKIYKVETNAIWYIMELNNG
jgi:ribosomal protein S18 acetylase RimI-like enzyme